MVAKHAADIIEAGFAGIYNCWSELGNLSDCPGYNPQLKYGVI